MKTSERRKNIDALRISFLAVSSRAVVQGSPSPEPRAAPRPAADLSQRDPSDPRRFNGRLRPRPEGRYPILPKTGDSVGTSGEVRGPKHAHVPMPVLKRPAIVDSRAVTASR